MKQLVSCKNSSHVLKWHNLMPYGPMLGERYLSSTIKKIITWAFFNFWKQAIIELAYDLPTGHVHFSCSCIFQIINSTNHSSDFSFTFQINHPSGPFDNHLCPRYERHGYHAPREETMLSDVSMRTAPDSIRPLSSGDNRNMRKYLGELYKDKKYFDYYMDTESKLNIYANL